MKGKASQAKLAVLDEIIAMCDSKATGPFEKAEPKEEEAEVAMVLEAEPKHTDGLEDLDIEDLMALYEKVKGKEENEEEVA